MVLYPCPLQHVAVTKLCLPLFLKGLAADVAFDDFFQPALRILLFDKLAIEFFVTQRFYDLVIATAVQPDSYVNILDRLYADTPIDNLLLVVDASAGINFIHLLNQSLTQVVSHQCQVSRLELLAHITRQVVLAQRLDNEYDKGSEEDDVHCKLYGQPGDRTTDPLLLLNPALCLFDICLGPKLKNQVGCQYIHERVHEDAYDLAKVCDAGGKLCL